jgi:ER-bound oxygenase mpaB/B'/Rubber oxygenase, catalytic domain
VLATMNWDQEKLGYPINQEDLVYTLLTFSYVIPRAMERLGAKVTAAQQEAYLHCWNVVGYVMGVREELLPANLADAGFLFAQIQRQQGGHSEAGEKLTTALISCIQSVLPNRWMKRLPRLLVRQLVGGPTADLLGVPKPTLLERAVMAVLRAVERVAEKLWRWITGKTCRKVGEAWVRCLTQMPRGWNRQLFDLPESLATSWGIRRDEKPITAGTGIPPVTSAQ